MTEHEKRIRDAICPGDFTMVEVPDLRALLADLDAARAALTTAKAGGWLPIEQASDADTLRCWVLVGESVHLAAYIVIGFEEKRDLDGCYIDQVDPDEYWMDIDSGDTLEPTHFQPLARPLPNPPKEQSAGGLGSLDDGA